MAERSLATAFLSAGARAVVYAVGKVDDAITERFVKTFYREYVYSGNASTAIDLARADITADSAQGHLFELITHSEHEYPNQPPQPHEG